MLVGQLLIPNPELKNRTWQEWGMLVFNLVLWDLECDYMSSTTLQT